MLSLHFRDCLHPTRRPFFFFTTTFTLLQCSSLLHLTRLQIAEFGYYDLGQ